MPARRGAKPAGKKGGKAAASLPPPVPVEDPPAPEPKAVVTKDTPNDPVVVGCEVGGVVDVRSKRGFVKYVGPVFFAEGTWVGIHFPGGAGEWDDAMNGEVDGTRYFVSEEKAALFLPKDEVEAEHHKAQMLKSEAAAHECRAALAAGPPVSLLSLSKGRDRFEGSQSRRTMPEKSHSLADSIAASQRKKEAAAAARRVSRDAAGGSSRSLSRHSSSTNDTGGPAAGAGSAGVVPRTGSLSHKPGGGSGDGTRNRHGSTAAHGSNGGGGASSSAKQEREAAAGLMSADVGDDGGAGGGAGNSRDMEGLNRTMSVSSDNDGFGGWDDSSPTAGQAERRRVLRHSVGYASGRHNAGGTGAAAGPGARSSRAASDASAGASPAHLSSAAAAGPAPLADRGPIAGSLRAGRKGSSSLVSAAAQAGASGASAAVRTPQRGPGPRDHNAAASSSPPPPPDGAEDDCVGYPAASSPGGAAEEAGGGDLLVGGDISPPPVPGGDRVGGGGGVDDDSDLLADRPPLPTTRKASLSHDERMAAASKEFTACLDEATRWLAKADAAAQAYHHAAAAKERGLVKQHIELAEPSDGKVVLPTPPGVIAGDGELTNEVEKLAGVAKPLADKLAEAPKIAACVVDAEEVVQRLIFEVESLQEEREQAAQAGDVDGVEKLYRDAMERHEALQQAREAVVESFAAFEDPLLEELNALVKTCRDAYRGTRMDAQELLETTAGVNEKTHQQVAAFLSEAETAKHLTRRDAQARKLAAVDAREAAGDGINIAVARLKDDIEAMRALFKKGVAAGGDHDAAVLQVGELDAELLEVKQKQEAERTRHAHVDELTAALRQRFEVLCMEVQTQLKACEADVVDRRGAVFSAHLDLRARHYDGYRETYLLLGDVQLKRSLQLAAVQAKVKRQMQLLEDCAESLNPAAKEHAQERDRLELICADLQATVDGLQDRMATQSDAPALTQTKTLLIQAGRELKDPEEEFLALKARSDRKLIDYYQDREENEGLAAAPSALPSSPHDKLLTLEMHSSVTHAAAGVVSASPTFDRPAAAGAVAPHALALDDDEYRGSTPTLPALGAGPPTHTTVEARSTRAQAAVPPAGALTSESLPAVAPVVG